MRISSNQYETHLSINEETYILYQPLYRIPMHMLGGYLLFIWRDESTTPLSLRKITCGIASIGLAIIGVVDTIVRLSFALLLKPFNKELSDQHMQDGIMSVLLAFEYVSHVQEINLNQETILSYIFPVSKEFKV